MQSYRESQQRRHIVSSFNQYSASWSMVVSSWTTCMYATRLLSSLLLKLLSIDRNNASLHYTLSKLQRVLPKEKAHYSRYDWICGPRHCSPASSVPNIQNHDVKVINPLQASDVHHGRPLRSHCKGLRNWNQTCLWPNRSTTPQHFCDEELLAFGCRLSYQDYLYYRTTKLHHILYVQYNTALIKYTELARMTSNYAKQSSDSTSPVPPELQYGERTKAWTFSGSSC